MAINVVKEAVMGRNGIVGLVVSSSISTRGASQAQEVVVVTALVAVRARVVGALGLDSSVKATNKQVVATILRHKPIGVAISVNNGVIRLAAVPV